jgi:pyruvate/2-oxoglutarate dehydrogenase complex dihydrolipoamide acyltransferase (E2) component
MLKLAPLAIVALVSASLAAPAAAQVPDAAPPPESAPQATPGSPDSTPVPCGQRLELFIGSVLSQFGRTNPSGETQRRALDAFKSAAEKAREMVRSACADERSAATVRELEAAQKQVEAALESLGPALEKLYASLSDQDKAQLDAFRRQVEVWLKDIWRDFALNFNQRPDADGRGGRDQFRFCFDSFCFSMPQFPDDRRGQRWRDYRDDSDRL